MNQETRIDKAIRLLESRYGQMVVVARLYAPAPDLIYDIVQQTCVDFLNGVRKKNWDLERDVTPLLARIVRDRATLYWRQRKRESRKAIQEIGERFLALSEKEEWKKEEQDNTELKAMRDCIDRLPPTSRDWVRRHYWDGIAIERIAQEQQIRPGTLRQTFTRIRETLRKCIEKNDGQ